MQDLDIEECRTSLYLERRQPHLLFREICQRNWREKISRRKLFEILYGPKHLRGMLPHAGSGDLRWSLRLARRELARRQNYLILVAIFCGLSGNTSNSTKTGEASPQARAFLQLVLSTNLLQYWLTTMSIEASLKRFDASAHPCTGDAYR